MNNRILATLFALVLIVAMFIGVAPVEAEAACAHKTVKNCECTSCKEAVHKNTEWISDSEEHRLVCKDCNEILENSTSHKNWSYKVVDSTKHEATCGVCGYKVVEEHTAAKTECRCKYCQQIMECDMEWHDDTKEHLQTCSICGKETNRAAHGDKTIVYNGDGTHSVTYTCCERGTLVRTCSDSNTDKDCLCDTCGAETDNHQLKNYDYLAPTCTEDGHKEYKQCEFCEKYFDYYTAGKEVSYEADLKLDKTGHDSKAAWSYDVNQHWHACNDCTEDKADLGDHIFTYKSNGDKTHTGTCDVCKQSVSTVTNQPHVDANNDCVCDALGCGYVMHDIEYVEAKPHTCTEDGWIAHNKCTKCNGTFLNLATYEVVDVKDPKAHNPYSTIEKDAEGHYQICRVCKEEVNREAHDIEYISYDETQHTVKCKDTKCGYKVRVDHVDNDKNCVCDICDRQLVHDLTHVSSKEATCTQAGNLPYDKCSVCQKNFDGALKEIANVVIPAKGHAWSAVGWNTEGKHQMYCDVCKTYSNGVDHYSKDGDCFCDVDDCNQPVHSHELIAVAQVNATCTEDGTKAYLKYEGCDKLFDLNQNPITAPEVIKATGHKLGTKVEAIDNDTHGLKCTVCGKFEQAVAHADTNGDNRCDGCGVELALEAHAEVPATCSANGKKAYWYSPVTGRSYYDAAGTQLVTDVNDLVIPKINHLWGVWSSNGQGGHVHTCTTCGASETEAHSNQIVACVCDICGDEISGHNVTLVNAVAPTCTKAGYESYIKCSCGNMFSASTGKAISEPVMVKATGHNMSTKVKEDVRQGNHYIECLDCDYRLYEDHVMAVEDPMRGNYHQWVCACGEIETAMHSDSDGDKLCDDCGHDMGQTQTTVTQHDNKTVVTGEAETIQPTKNWFTNWLNNLVPGNAGAGATASSNANTQVSSSSNTTVKADKDAVVEESTNNVSNNTNTNTGSSAESGSTGTVTETETTGIINQIIQFLSQLFNSLLG